MLKRGILVLFLSIIVTSNLSRADEDPALVSAKKSRRPKIGLVLEGGGALGFAHVGVMKVLEQNRIAVDLVTGTSIGSIVGAGYASGLSVEEMEKALSETDWDKLFGEKVKREDLNYRLKPGRNRELFGEMKIGIKDGELVPLAGLIEGQNVLPLFQKLFGNYPTPCDFDSLPLPFRAVAADLETGEAFVPNSGDLATVVRASMSVPGIFSPVQIDNRILVDGGIVNNLPVDIARNMGADILIVIALDDELAKIEHLNSLLEISGQMIGLLLKQNSDISRKTLTPQDVLIPVDLKGFGAGDFAKAREIMEKGEIAAKQFVSKLRHLALSESEFRRYSQKRVRKEPQPVRLDFVRVKNTTNISDERILRDLRAKAGDTFDVKQVEEDVQKIYGSGYYNSVRYSLVKENGQTGLQVETLGRGWLQQYLRLGFGLEDNFEGDSAFRLGAAYRYFDLTTKGSYAEGQFEVGKNPRVGMELYQPLGENSRYFIAPAMNYGQTNIQVRDSGETIARYDRTEGVASFLLGRDLAELGEAGIGLSRGFGKLDRDIGDPTLPDFDYDIGEAIARIDIDQVDTPDFPTRGYAARLHYISSLTDLGADDSFDTLTGAFTIPITFDRDTFIFGADFASTFSERPVERSFALGGFLDVSGFQQGALTASEYQQGKFIYFHRFSEVQNPLFNMGFFFGGSLEYTSIDSDAEQLADRHDIISGSIFLGADTPLLPTYLGYGRNDEQEDSFYLAVGRIGQVRR